MITDAKCTCRHCNGHLSFDRTQAGTTINCPHCGLDTILFIPSPSPKPETPLDFIADRPPGEQPFPRERILFIVTAIVTVIGCIGIGINGLDNGGFSDPGQTAAEIVGFILCMITAMLPWLIYFKLCDIHEVIRKTHDKTP